MQMLKDVIFQKLVRILSLQQKRYQCFPSWSVQVSYLQTGALHEEHGITDLQASWWGSGSLRGRLWGIRVSYRKPSVLHLHSWNTRPLSLWSTPPSSSSCRGLSSSACDLCPQMEDCSVQRQGRRLGAALQKSHWASVLVAHLWSDAQKSTAVWRSTFTHRLPVSQTLQVVVEGEFCAWQINQNGFHTKRNIIRQWKICCWQKKKREKTKIFLVTSSKPRALKFGPEIHWTQF